MKTYNYIFESVLKKTLEESSSKAMEIGAGKLFMNIIPVMFVSPVASIIASVSKEFISTLLEKTKNTEIKIDRLLVAPFKTGTRELMEVIELIPQNEAENNYRLSTLRDANKHLNEAYDLVDEEHKLLVRAFQTMGLAISSGADQTYFKYLDELKKRRDELHIHSISCQNEAIEMGESLGGKYGPAGIGKVAQGTINYYKKKLLYEELEKAKEFSSSLDEFIKYIENIRKIEFYS